jgi:uncharacterized protein (TIGR03437 family)
VPPILATATSVGAAGYTKQIRKKVRMSRPHFAFLLVALLSAAPPAHAQRNGRASDFDIRDLPPAAADRLGREQARTVVERRRQELQAFVQRTPGARIAANRHGLPKTFFRDAQPLAAPSTLTAEDASRAFLRAHRALMPFTDAEIDALRLTGKDASGRAVFVAFQQTWNGLDVYNGQLKLTLNAAGEVLIAGVDDAVPQLQVSNARRLTPEQAVAAAFDNLGLPRPQLSLLAPRDGKTQFRNPRSQSYNPIAADLVVFPLTATTGRLAYRLSVESGPQSWHEILIDAGDGRVLLRHNLYQFAQARVWPQSPMDPVRELVTLPDGWLPPGGTQTNGNNVDAFLDANGDDRADNNNNGGLSGGRAFAADQIFDFPFSDGRGGANPRAFQAAAVTNAFYLINKAHDYFYDLGFTEAAGNFQFGNFGRGGAGNDPVIAEIQHSGLANNASFATPGDGSSPRMRLGIFSRGTSTQTDDLDAAFDGAIVIHEYTHGVSNRLVGARVNTTCLNGLQSRAMGEGWSDYFASSFFNNPVHGFYVTQNPAHGTRRFSYEGYPLTYEDFGTQRFEVHDDGELWAAALWDLRTALGQEVADRLVIDGLKATPCRPSMTAARDAILAVDAANGGANRARIWQVFARHGLGFSAGGIDGAAYPGIYYNSAFDRPADLQGSGNPAIVGGPPAPLPRAGEEYTYPINATNPAAGTLAFGIRQGPQGMTVDSGGVLRWNTGTMQQRVKIAVTDGKGGSVVHGFLVTPDTPLELGSAVNIEGPRDAAGYFNVTVPANTPILQFTIRGGTGDVDLDVFDPDGINYFSFQDGNNETISIPTPKPGRWRIAVDGFLSFTGAALTAAAVVPTPVEANTEVTGLRGVTSSEVFYRFTVPAGATALAVRTSGGVGDVDLYLRPGLPATCQGSAVVFEPCPRDVLFSENDGNSEIIRVSSPAPGDWYIALTAYDAYSGVTLSTEVAMPVPALSIAPATLSFTQAAGAAAPAPQTFRMTFSPIAANWTASAATAGGGNWLSVTPTSGSGDATLQVSVSAAGLAQGAYLGSIAITAAGASGSPRTIDVVLAVGAVAAPRITTGGIVGAGGSVPAVTTISPGGIVSLFGTGFAGAGAARAVQASDFVAGNLPTSLAGTCVLVDGKRAFLTFVGAGQINLQTPAVALDTLVDVQVLANCGAPNEFRSPVIQARTAAAAPEFLYWTPAAGGRNPVVAVNSATGAYIGAPGLIPGLTFTPASPGDILTIYGVGFGPTSPSFAPGEPPARAGATANAPQVTLGGTSLAGADILYAGVSPGIAGLYQLNIRVPAGAADGDHALVLTLGAFQTPVSTLSVRRGPTLLEPAAPSSDGTAPAPVESRTRRAPR